MDRRDEEMARRVAENLYDLNRYGPVVGRGSYGGSGPAPKGPVEKVVYGTFGAIVGSVVGSLAGMIVAMVVIGGLKLFFGFDDDTTLGYSIGYSIVGLFLLAGLIFGAGSGSSD